MVNFNLTIHLFGHVTHLFVSEPPQEIEVLPVRLS